MSGLEDFTAELESRLEQRRAELDEDDLPGIKQHFVRMQSSFEAIHNLLKKKGLLKQDPYNYEERLSELDVPSDGPYTDGERDAELGIRLGKYESRLSYVTEYFDFSLGHLDLKRLKTVVKFVNYINWRNFTDTSSQPTTRGLAELVAKVKQGGDTLSTNIVSDAHLQLSAASKEVLSVLKKVSSYQRESYKLVVRASVFNDPAVPSQPAASEYDQAARTVKSVFAKHMPGQPFARELILEIFAENNPDSGPTVREALLRELGTTKKVVAKKQPGSDMKDMLIDAARTIAGVSRAIDESIRKLSDNALVLESKKLSFGEVVKQIWERIRGSQSEARIYALEIVDAASGTRRTENLNYDEFVASLAKRARIYNGILSKSGPAWTKLLSSEEDALLQFLTRDVQEVHIATRRLEALETFFRTEVPREQRSQLRSIGSQLASLNEQVVRARKKTRQYVAKLEERDQLRKLGIDV